MRWPIGAMTQQGGNHGIFLRVGGTGAMLLGIITGEKHELREPLAKSGGGGELVKSTKMLK